ncbi:uncharacterized protein SPAPADRAFT_52658 [Spathaspora passalidarum NRRL Y-27907]|uniref:Uncharacterized protein n=1 Tax=Spathaspora passalidarum (strain NRRL Y-27907 / 11-Y1) TaxID=619300 RepID=G3AUN0_SPAPN|nr:uncharacterized protein SPAPADRAFT_52658 [Spathaspora passalidarum NRRL Y-27907]EGW30586.1 hypothetical protein SPAPADRAFT_52658 [Spathaspora passalidarum NRRL Y-27907]
MIYINSNELLDYYLNSFSHSSSTKLPEDLINNELLISSKIEQILSRIETNSGGISEESEEFETVDINDIIVDEDAFLSHVANTLSSGVDEAVAKRFTEEQKLHRLTFLKEIKEKGLSLRHAIDRSESSKESKDSSGTFMNY